MTNSDDAQVAAQIAEHAGKLLMLARSSGLLQGKALGAAGDLIANAFITTIVRQSNRRAEPAAAHRAAPGLDAARAHGSIRRSACLSNGKCHKNGP